MASKTTPTDNDGQLLHVELDRLHTDPDQPRKHFDKQGLKDLADDIAARGILQPLLIRDYVTENETRPGEYIIVTGERRFRAARMAKLDTVPGYVDNSANDAPLDRLLAQISENFSRADLNPIELAHFFSRLVDDFGYTAGAVPKLLESSGLKAMSRSYVSNTMRLIRLPEWAQQYIIDGKITQRHGLALLPALHSEQVLKDLKGVIDDRLQDYEQYGEPFTVEHAQEVVHDLFFDNHPMLDLTYGDDATLYKWDEKKDGEALGIVKITLSNGRHHHFALNHEEHERRQQEAKAKVAARKSKQQQTASDTNKKTGNNKTGQAATPEKEIRRPPDHKLHTYLFGVVGSESTPNGGWLRRHLLSLFENYDQFPEDTANMHYRLFVWCALQCPEPGPPFMAADMPVTNDSAVTGKIDVAETYRLGNIIDCLTGKPPLSDIIESQARHAISRMHDQNLALLAAHLEVNLDAAWRVDEDYLALYTGPALDEMAESADLNCEGAKVAEKREWLLSKKEAIGVTDDIRRIWTEALDDAQREVTDQREALEKTEAEAAE